MTCACTIQIAGDPIPGTDLHIPGTCNVIGCECDQLSVAPCAPPRDDAACREAIADAVGHCDVFAGQHPARPNAANVDLRALDELCPRVRDGCEVGHFGEYCTEPDLGTAAITARCVEICEAYSQFIDAALSDSGPEYTCGRPQVTLADGRQGTHEECRLDCPDVPCAAGNLDRCTVVQTRAGARCSGDFTSDRFCRAPDEAVAPGILASFAPSAQSVNAGGIFAELSTRRSHAVVNEAASLAIVDVGAGAIVTNVRGYVDVLGEPCPNAACLVSFRLTLEGAPADPSVDLVRLSAGTGTSPVVRIAADGSGVIAPTLLSGTVSVRAGGREMGFLTGTSIGLVNVQLDWNARTLRLVDGFQLVLPDGTLLVSHMIVDATIQNEPPTALGGPDLAVDCAGASGATITLEGRARDPDGPGDIFRVGWYRGAAFDGPGGGELIIPWYAAQTTAPPGEHVYTFFVQDRSLQQHSDTITVSVASAPPVANAGPDLVVECASHAGSVVALDGSASIDPQGGELDFSWWLGGDVIAEGAEAQVMLPWGEHGIELRVESACGGVSSDFTTVSVIDTTPPSLVDFLYQGPACLWPPNHGYAVLRTERDLRAVVQDACDPDAAVVILDAWSDQPDDGAGDGHSHDDAVALGDRVCLRAERAGGDQAGRTYSIDILAQDASGNVTDPVVQVVVPHDQRAARRCEVLLSNLETVPTDDPICRREAKPAPSHEPVNDDTPPAAAAGSAGCGAATSHTGLLWLLVVPMGLAYRRGKGRATPKTTT